MAAAPRLSPRGRAVTRELKDPHATHRGAYQQFRFVWPKHWQRLHWSERFGATYDSTVTRRPQSCSLLTCVRAADLQAGHK